MGTSHSFRCSRVATILCHSAVSVLALGLGSCGAGNLRQGSTYTANDETSIVVLGVASDMRVQIGRVTWGEHGWTQSIWETTGINTVANDGYIVAEVAPTGDNESYAITQLIPGFLEIWRVCGGDTVATFRVPPRSVVYVGDIAFDPEVSHRLGVSHDLEKARAFLSTAFPDMARQLEDGKLVTGLMEDGNC